MGRWVTLVLSVLLVASGCRQPPPDAPGVSVAGSVGVAVDDVTALSAGTDDAGMPMQYLVCTLTFTNVLGGDVVPQIVHFEFVDAIGHRFAAVGAGGAAIVGLSNSGGLLHRGEMRRYTLAFRVPVEVAGTIYYDPT
ncbi:MAG: hypothetical protein ACREM8_04085 [Vulcanimicrobiaceae bacterium]